MKKLGFAGTCIKIFPLLVNDEWLKNVHKKNEKLFLKDFKKLWVWNRILVLNQTWNLKSTNETDIRITSFYDTNFDVYG